MKSDFYTSVAEEVIEYLAENDRSARTMEFFDIVGYFTGDVYSKFNVSQDAIAAAAALVRRLRAIPEFDRWFMAVLKTNTRYELKYLQEGYVAWVQKNVAKGRSPISVEQLFTAAQAMDRVDRYGYPSAYWAGVRSSISKKSTPPLMSGASLMIDFSTLDKPLTPRFLSIMIPIYFPSLRQRLVIAWRILFRTVPKSNRPTPEPA